MSLGLQEGSSDTYKYDFQNFRSHFTISGFFSHYIFDFCGNEMISEKCSPFSVCLYSYSYSLKGGPFNFFSSLVKGRIELNYKIFV